MASEIKVELNGLQAFIDAADAEARRIETEMRDVVDLTGREVINQSQTDAPKGETSHLTQSHVWQMDAGFNRIGNQQTGISGRARVLAKYAAAQNFGIPGRPVGGAVRDPAAVGLGPVDIHPDFLGATPGVQQVRAHTRVITQAFGRPLDAPVTINVRAHLRRMNLPGTFFFSNALSDAESKFERRLQEVVNG